jgi:hypothetical protein
MSLTGISFVIHYEEMLDHLDKTMKPEFRHLIFKYRYLDPHDLVTPDDVFLSMNEMIKHLATLIIIDYIEGDPINRN